MLQRSRVGQLFEDGVERVDEEIPVVRVVTQEVTA
jgi:hypothetical protein